VSLLDLEPRSAASGTARGVSVALVTQNSAKAGPDRKYVELGMVKVSFPWSQDRQSHWARIATPMAGKERGLFILPEVGDEVLVAFEQDDITQPYIIGMLWNGKDRPPEFNGDGRNDKRVFRSRHGHRLVFDDGDQGAVSLELNAGDCIRRIVMDASGVKLEDGRGNSIEFMSDGAGSLSISSKGALSIAAQSIRIEAQTNLDVSANATLSVKGTMVQIN